MGLEEIAQELYGLLPEEFTAARDWRSAQLRKAGERELSAAVKLLRRPAVAAWLVNTLTRQRAAEVDRLLQLGAALREAQAALDADQLRELNRRRQEVLGALGREARALARALGRPVGEQVADDVEETLRTALADPAAAEAVRTGRLTVALSYAGFGTLDPADVVAVAPTRAPRPALGPLAGTHDDVGSDAAAAGDVAGNDPVAADEAARQAAEAWAWAGLRAAEELWHQAEVARRRAEQHRDVTLRRVDAARERVDVAKARVADLEAVIASARANEASATSAWEPLRAEADDAMLTADTARSASDAARVAVDVARSSVADMTRSSVAGSR